MPKYPAKPAKWVHTIYGGNVSTWDRAKAQCRATLFEWARLGRFGTYTELSQAVNAIEWPDGAYTHAGRQIGFLLGQVSVAELDEIDDRPLLSTLVVSQDDGMPARGYWDLLAELGVDVPRSDVDRAAVWAGELQRVFDVYGSADRTA